MNRPGWFLLGLMFIESSLIELLVYQTGRIYNMCIAKWSCGAMLLRILHFPY